ncbi:MAG: hypothetical protein K0Q52_369 [Microbacterium sp.]|jgi:hypothetical protein|nr:hypothetical protein [Microbacterium sp.]
MRGNDGISNAGDRGDLASATETHALAHAEKQTARADGSSTERRRRGADEQYSRLLRKVPALDGPQWRDVGT